MQWIWTIALLTISNIFMTFAWYGHLKFKSSPLWIAIAVSWLIALLEYCFQVPANRLGSAYFSTAQLKVMQEVITLVVFGAFSVIYLKEQFRWNYLVAFVLIVGAVFFVFAGGEKSNKTTLDHGQPAPAVATSHDAAIIVKPVATGKKTPIVANETATGDDTSIVVKQIATAQGQEIR